MLGLSSEVSLPPVSKLCEEFDCVPAAGAAACPANENALSLLSSSAIDCKVRSYPLAGSVGDLRLITCELQLLCGVVVIRYVIDDVAESTITVRQGRTVALHLFSRTLAVRDLEPKEQHDSCPLAGGYMAMY